MPELPSFTYLFIFVSLFWKGSPLYVFNPTDLFNTSHPTDFVRPFVTFTYSDNAASYTGDSCLSDKHAGTLALVWFTTVYTGTMGAGVYTSY